MDERDIEAVQHREDEEDHDDAPLNHTTTKEERENGWDNLSIAVSASNICVSISTTTRKTFKPRKTWNFEASENWAPLTDEQKPAIQTWPKSHSLLAFIC